MSADMDHVAPQLGGCLGQSIQAVHVWLAPGHSKLHLAVLGNMQPFAMNLRLIEISHICIELVIAER